MQKQFRIVPMALATSALCGVLGAVAQNAQPNKNALPEGGSKPTLNQSRLSLEESLLQSKVITHNSERKALWKALWKVWTKTFESSKTDLAVNNGAHITVYAENESATQLCFYRDGKIYTFDIGEGQITPLVMAKVLPPINAITFQDGKGAEGPKFVLWCNGQPEASIDASPE